MKPALSSRSVLIGLAFALALIAAPLRAVDVDGNSSAELDLWFKLDADSNTRLLILNSWARDSARTYSETVFGVALDHRINDDWSLRAGVRRITQESDPSDGEETRAVLDAKYFLPLGDDWLLTDRSRVDLRLIEGDGFSARFRNRVMIEKPFTVFACKFTAFGSYELFYDTRHEAFSRQNFNVGISVPLGKWAAADLYYAREFAITPDRDTTGSLGVAISLTF